MKRLIHSGWHGDLFTPQNFDNYATKNLNGKLIQKQEIDDLQIRNYSIPLYNLELNFHISPSKISLFAQGELDSIVKFNSRISKDALNWGKGYFENNQFD